VDVAGWIPAGTDYHPITPARVLDTRAGLGAPKKKVTGNSAISVQVTGHGGVPVTGVAAIEANVTVVGPSQAGFITAYPSGATRPTASMLNYDTGQIVANSTTIKVSDTGELSLYTGWGTTDLILDITGYWTTTPPPPALKITTSSLPGGTVGGAYSATLAATGGTASYAWSAAGLPAGLTLEAASGKVSGTPTTAATSTVTVTVKDAAGKTAT
jgi:hypothetical protein